jgi:hypothetical protein
MTPLLRLRRRSHGHPRLAFAAAALAMTACGPTPPFELAVHAVPGDVVYGAQTSPSAVPAPSAAPPVALAPGAPPLIYGAPTAPVPTFAPTPTATPAPACATAPVDAVPALAADPSATVPPVPAAYLWHEQGTYKLGGDATLPFSPQLTHTVANVSAADPNTGAYSFDVTTSSGGLTGLQRVTSSYQVIPPPQGATQVQGVQTSQAAGLYLTAMAVQDTGLPTSRVEKFAPPILLMQFPGTDLPTWSAAGHDSVSQDTLTLNGAVTGHVPVDACGTVIDAWEVKADGTLVGPNQNLTLHLVYDVATQFGGIVVREVTSASGTELTNGSMQNVTSGVTATTSVVPKQRAG